jgi:hypothetical protein
MPPTTALHTIGFYCGRHGSGLLDEPQNSFSNAAFVIGAALAYWMWKRSANPDRLLLALMVMLAFIGVGSFIFHSYPTPVTLYVDLVPIQVYILAVLAYVLTRLLRCSWAMTGAILLAFFLLRQAWMLIVPQGLLGGGVTHVPTLIALLIFTFVLARRGLEVWKYLVAGAASYVVALLVRSWDVPLCDSFPLGVHWVWHIGTALAGTLVLVGLIRSEPRAKSEA